MSQGARRDPSRSESSPLLEFDGVSLVTGERTLRRVLVRDVSFAVSQGEALGLVGPSGVGKTLLTRAALGLLPRGVEVAPGSSIRVDGVEMVGAPLSAWRGIRGRRIGTTFQDAASALTPVRSIGAQLREVLRVHGRDVARTPELLAEVGLDPDTVPDQAPHALSGGMRQRALLAMALASEPGLLIADEPTAALDVLTENRIVELLGSLRARRELGLLLVSHDPVVVHRLCERVVHLDVGSDGVATTTLGRSRNSAASSAYSSSVDTPRGTHEGTTTKRPAGPDRGAAPTPGVSTPGDRPPLLQVDDLSVGYARGWTVRDATFHLDRGELLGLVGPSGSGKTTLLRGLLGLAPRSRGSVSLEGIEVIRDRPGRQRFRRRVQGVWQDALGALDPRLSVGRSLDEALRVSRPDAPSEERMEEVEVLLRRVGLPAGVAGSTPGALSGGQRQRVGIARALAMGPDVVLLDEPVSALDVEAREAVLELITGLLTEAGVAGILCAHDLDVVARRCRRVAVMDEGRIVDEGVVARLLEAPGHPLSAAMTRAFRERSRRPERG